MLSEEEDVFNYIVEDESDSLSIYKEKPPNFD